MVTAELINYIKGQLSQGKAQEGIKTNLLSQGWNETDINLAFSQSVANQPTTPQPSVNTNENNTSKVSRKKLVAYFLIGFFTHIFGLFVAGLWILIKVKENKKPRVISLLLGFATTVVIAILFSIFISPMLQQTIANKFPEMAYIPNELIKNYPDVKFGINIASTKSLTGQEAGVTTSILTVSAMSNYNLSSSDRKQIGEKVCALLEQHNDSYTNVEIAQVTIKKILFFPIEQSFTEGRTCQEWNENPPYELPIMTK